MDPNEALKALRANPTRETFDALDAWISSGGFLPNDWRPRQPDVIKDVASLWAYIKSGQHYFTKIELAEEIEDACAVGVDVEVVADGLLFNYRNFDSVKLLFPFTVEAYEAALDPVEDEEAE